MESFKTIYEFNDYDDGKFGKLMEQILSRKEYCERQNAPDLYGHRRRIEIKTSAGTLSDDMGNILKGISTVFYFPVVRIEENGMLDLEKQEGYILTKENFIQAIQDAGLFRIRKGTDGRDRYAINTFWNRKKNAPHGKKYFTLCELLEQNCIETYAEWLDREINAKNSIFKRTIKTRTTL